MNLAKDRFYKGQYSYFDQDNKLVELPMFSYETKNGLYDIIDNNGALLVRTNTGHISQSIADWHRIHYEIMNHFQLGES